MIEHLSLDANFAWERLRQLEESKFKRQIFVQRL